MPSGTVTIKVGSTQAEVTDNAVAVKSGTIDLMRYCEHQRPGQHRRPVKNATQSITSDADILATGQSDKEYRGDVLGFNMRGIALPITGKYLD